MNVRIILSLLLLAVSTGSAFSQGSKPTVHSIGYYHLNVPVTHTDGSKAHYTLSGGALLAPPADVPAFPSPTDPTQQVQVHSGFPATIAYFPVVFTQPMFASKGYYGEYVQLTWQVNALASRITRFRIFRKIFGQEGDSTLIASTAGDIYSFRDEFADKGTIYKYTLYADGLANGLVIPGVNQLEGLGFSMPTGVATGQISYAGGNAVKGVRVVAETDGAFKPQTARLQNQGYLSIPHDSRSSEMELRNGFTFQAWFKDAGTSAYGVLFSKGNDYELGYDPTGNGTLRFKVANATADLTFKAPIDTFFHVSASYLPAGELKLYVHVNELIIDSVKVAAGNRPNANTNDLLIGRNEAGNYFNGYADEMRLWRKQLDYPYILASYNRYIAGNEADLSGYWRISAGVSPFFFDMARKGNTFYENHGNFKGAASWSDVIPFPSQLGFVGVTDKDGNYTIVGFPYETGGSLYRFIPILGVHQFDPALQLRFVGDGESVHNQVDFTDISSFRVTGTVEYRHSFFPVEGCSILIDGQPSVDSEGNLTTTNADGFFAVDVPIGLHSLRVAKQGHEFDRRGYYVPIGQEDKNIPLFDYQAPVTGLEFTDLTLVKLTGKVVGGPREADKPLGFGRSVNNLGNATITLQAEKLKDLTRSDSTVTYLEEDDFNTKARFLTTTVTLNPDQQSGEYIAFLPPERYSITSITAGNYTFDESYRTTLDLQTYISDDIVYQDTVYAEIEGVPVPGFDPVFDSLAYDSYFSFNRLDTTFFVGVDSFYYDVRKDFILRVRPNISVTNAEGGAVFGEREFEYVDDIIGETTIKLIEDNDTYAFGHPVFFQRNEYQMVVDVFEEYINANNGGAVDRVPVNDGKIEVVNNLATVTQPEPIGLNSFGRGIYRFRGGYPQINLDSNNPTDSYTRTLTLTAVTGQNQDVRTDWNNGQPLKAVVFGGVPQGNNFVTTGPNQIVTILRDPPGSNSYAFLEEGSQISQSTNWNVGASSSLSASVTADLGARVVTFSGYGVGTINETETIADVTVGLSAEFSYGSNGEEVTTITNTQTWSTIDGPPYVGYLGDVFVGYATNIVYGAAISLQPIPQTSTECLDGNCGPNTNSQGFKLGTRRALRINPEFSTGFIYSQLFIEQQLLPNLAAVRNSYLQFVENPDAVTPTDRPVYISLVPPTDERFGLSNGDRKAWGNQATPNLGVGPSYIIKAPAGMTVEADSVEFYNTQINDWKFWLAENEKQKVKASLLENVSIDGGASLSRTSTFEESETVQHDFSTSISAFMSSQLGFEVLGIGTTVNLGVSVSVNGGLGFGETSVNSTTYGYVLSDGESARTDGGTYNDYMSVDVKEPADGFGPVFVLRAGATSCPYEGELLTQYYQPGQHTLQFASLNVEKAEMNIVNPVVNNVPENRQAEMKLQIFNLSEANTSLWVKLVLDDQSNPNGLVVDFGGTPLTADGRDYLIQPNETLTQTFKVTKGAADVFEYENVKLKIASTCGDDVTLSEASFSVYFQPGCSDIRLTAPVDLWTVNTFTVPEEQMEIVFDQYDVQNSQFKYAAFQYKASSSSQWITNMLFYNPNTVTIAEYQNLNEPKAWLDLDGTTNYVWNMSSLPDRNYDLRVVTYCELAPGEFATTPTEIHSGIKDVKRPQIFGSAQPADGILSANDEISVQFDEELEGGLVGLNNFSVQGVLNNYEIAHDASVNFDGIDNYVAINEGLGLAGAFSLEFWLKRNDFGREQVVFSKGNIAGDVLEIGFDANDRFFVDYPGQDRIVTTLVFNTTAGNPADPAFVPDNKWNHYTVTYDPTIGELFAYRSGKYILEQVDITGSYSGIGPVNIGKGAVSNDRHFNGNLHELRIWNRFRQIGIVVSQFNQALSGAEIGLVGYWPMEEAFGSQAFDKARFRHAQVFADWTVLPVGRAYAFDGADDYLQLSTASTIVITKDMDFTLEWWFKAPAQTNTVMFSSGKGDGSASDLLNTGSWSVGFNENGDLYVANQGNYIVLDDDDQNYQDDNWHHFALTLSRRGNTSVFVDGVREESVSSSNFGTLAGQYMWIGARGFKTSTVQFGFDHHFNGIIDEFRAWNLQRKQSQISLDMTSQVPFDQMGLLGYFPFERYVTNQGQQEMIPTLLDMWSPPQNIVNGGTAVAFGAADFSAETAKIKQARPVTKVDFTYAVNGDMIILTPAPSMAAVIEKTILEITVDRVEDKNGNRIASPITWTAFIDQNQLKWGTDVIELSKELYQPLSFQVEVVNASGTEQEFRIENLPPWLSVSPQSGSLAPASVRKVTFKVDAGINTGTYSRDLFLSGDFGFDEKLILDLRVFRPLPEDWKVTPSDFQFSMNVIGELEIEGRLSADPNDQLGVFVDGECRGFVSLQYVPAYDNYEAFLTLYSNQVGGEKLDFKIWDDSEGQVFTQVTPSYTFEANRNYGTPAQPVRFQTAKRVEADIKVPAGWKWVSFGLFTNELSDVNRILKDVAATDGDQVKGAQQFDQYLGAANQWLGTISNNGGFRNEEMYKLKVQKETMIRYEGEIPTPSQKPISVIAGWNWVGFISQRNMETNEALQGFNATDGDIIKSQYQLAVYDQNFGWIGNLTSLIPGEGYMLLAQNTGTIVYPNASSLSGGRTAEKQTDLSFLELGDFTLNPHQYARQMNVVAHVANYAFGTQPSERLVATVNGLVRGIALPQWNPVTEQYDYFLTLYAQADTEEVDFYIAEANGKVIGQAIEKVDFAENVVEGNVKQPFVLNLRESFHAEEPSVVEVYPNPFGQQVSVRFSVEEASVVQIEVFDAIGRRISVLASGLVSSGQQEFVWKGTDESGKDLPAGLYHLRVTINGSATHRKLVKR